MFLSYLALFVFNDTATTEIYTLSLHDALPILHLERTGLFGLARCSIVAACDENCAFIVRRGQNLMRKDSGIDRVDRKSTRLNSSHRCIAYAVFCLKKKKKKRKVK